MGYRVIENFSDMLCGGFEYKVGDSYPDHKFEASAARIAALASNNNKLGRPLIRKEIVEVKVEPKQEMVEPFMNQPIEPTIAESEPTKRRGGRRRKSE